MFVNNSNQIFIFHQPNAFITLLAVECFEIFITNKLAAQIVPVIGAVTGASLNTFFTDFYQDMARGHFIIKRLEIKYGYEQVESEYKKIVKGDKDPLYC